MAALQSLTGVFKEVGLIARVLRSF